MHKLNLYSVPIFFALGLVFIVPSVASATCGNVIYNGYDDNGLKIELSEPIIDCANPFNADIPEPFVASLTLANQPVVSDSVVTISSTTEISGTYSTDKQASPFESLQIYKVEGQDYRQIDFIEAGKNFTLPALTAGDYVAVIDYTELFMQAQAVSPWKSWLKQLFIPNTAYAFYDNYSEVVAIPFTVQYEAVAPTGASSVLFLPGIQASRLYTKGILGTENQLWEPNINADVEKLEMTGDGVSVNELYTNDVIDEVNVSPILQENIYKSFLSKMVDLESESVIKNFSTFAYDWRYSVLDVATKPVIYKDESKLLVDEVLALADDSYTGKVTIVAHSNGGLVAKALLQEYGDTSLAGKIDKLIMIGTPQLGTPKAIGSMLHGLDQSLGFGFIASANTTRQVTKNLPGAYTLLPSPKYFEKNNESIITTDGSSLTKIVSDYGNINTSSQLQDFLLNSLQNRAEAVGLSDPITLNSKLATESLLLQKMLDNWQAPAGVDVYEVVGTGLATISGYEYRTFSCTDSNPMCILHSYLKPFPLFSNQGDQTVMALSAEGYDGNKTTAKVNLKEENTQFLNVDNTHKSLTESSVVQDFVTSVIKYPYLTEAVTVPDFTEVSSRYRIISVQSPVSLLATDIAGNKVGLVNGEVREDVSGSQYFEFGEGKYLILPSNVNAEIELVGTGDGVYSMTVDEVNESGKQNQISLLTGATTSLNMKAKFSIENGKYSSLKTDLDNDGVIDLEQALNGEIINNYNISYDYTDLKLAIKNLHLNRNYEITLLLKINLAELLHKKSDNNIVLKKLEIKALALVAKELDKLSLKRLVTNDEVLAVKKIINHLN